MLSEKELPVGDGGQGYEAFGGIVENVFLIPFPIHAIRRIGNHYIEFLFDKRDIGEGVAVTDIGFGTEAAFNFSQSVKAVAPVFAKSFGRSAFKALLYFVLNSKQQVTSATSGIVEGKELLVINKFRGNDISNK